MAHLTDAVTFYDRAGPDTYELITHLSAWQGPSDMAMMLRDVDLRDATVVDVGIGNGPLSDLFRSAGAARIIGVDGAQSQLDYCLKNNKADEVVQCDLNDWDMPLETASADVITCSGLFSYLADPSFFVADIARVLKPEGTALINFHPARNHRELERISAVSLFGKGAFVNVYHHAPEDLATHFATAGMRVQAAKTNPRGIYRFMTDKPLPLTTMSLRKI